MSEEDILIASILAEELKDIIETPEEMEKLENLLDMEMM